MFNRADPAGRELGESPQDVVARALAIVEEETRAWAELRQRKGGQAPRVAAARPGDAR